ncbi:MAG: AAA family ATPase [Solirubrobacteraceae bacterium]|nr:AAA family ATPase [Solirubrobacteraceae bacterium]
MTASGTLVGRDRELAELRQGLEGALAERGRLFMVAGDPGVGKTALADAIGTEAVAAGATVLWGRAWDGGGAPSYWPWLRILRRLGSQRDIATVLATLSPETTGRLMRLVPSLARAPKEHASGADRADAVTAPAAAGVAAPDPGDSDAGRFQLFDAITSLLRAAAGLNPLVLILDDMHGADRPSLLLLDFLAVHVRDAPILIVGTYREDEARLDTQLAATLADILRHGQRLPLRGLREHDVAEVVRRVAGRPAPDRVVRAIHSATEGNPFFVDEVVRLLSAEGRLDDIARVADVRIPDGVRETIRDRLQPLPEATRSLLLTASVIGREFRLDMLQRVAGCDASTLDAALGEAVASGVVVERPPALGVYGFAQGLIRETLYSDLGPQRRGELHRAVGLALEQRYAGDIDQHVAELAHHFFVAATTGDLAKALDYSVRAGERALALLAYEAAAEHFERALHVLGLQERADVPRRCDLLLALATAQSRAGDASTARDTFLRAAAVARGIGSAAHLARAALGYGAGMGGFEFGRVDGVLVGLLGEALEALEDGDSALHARVLGRMATELYFSDRADERVGLAEQAVSMARRLGDRATLASTLSARFLTLLGPEHGEERLQIASDVIALGEDVRDRELVLRGHAWRVLSLMELADWVGAEIELAVHARLADELRDPLHLWYVPLFEASRALLQGRLRDAERFADQAFTVGRGVQAQNAEQLHVVQRFALRAEQGRLAEIEGVLEEFARRYPAIPVWRAADAFVLSVLGRMEQARRGFEALTGGGPGGGIGIGAGAGIGGMPRDGEWLATVALLVRTGARLGDARRCAELGLLLAPYVDRAVIAGRGALCLGPVARFAGLAAATAGHPAEAAVLLEQALATARRWGADSMATGIELELAEVVGERPKVAVDKPAVPGASSSSGLAAAAQRRSRGEDGERGRELTGADGTAPVRAAGHAFYRRGDIWTIGPPGREIQLRDAKGLSHVARLLGAPHVEVHALDLGRDGSGARRSGRGRGSAAKGSASAAIAADAGIEIHARGEDGAGPALDNQAKAAYRARVAELQAQVDEAEALHDPARAARLREELDFLTRELSSAVGLHGRDRKTGSDAERARVNVTRAIRTALKRLSEHDPELGRRLDADIRTGIFCAYEPAPGDAPKWDLTGPA